MRKSICIVFALLLGMNGCRGGEVNPPAEEPEVSYANTHVVYECNERLFANQQAFRVIEQYVPALKETGVDVLWLMPIHPRGTVKSVGSPYCVQDYYAVDPAFGTMDDLRSLVRTCHSLGMRVLLDWVANHTAWDNAWYTSHPEWYTTPTAEETGWKDVCPLDYTQPAVCQAMQEALCYWVREADVDGFRCDYAHGVPQAFWQEAIASVRAIKPDAIFFAETSKAAYYDAGFDWLYSWDYLGAVQSLYEKSLPVSQLLSVSEKEWAQTPAGKDRMRNSTSHDASAEHAPSSFYHSAKGELSASCLTYFLGGIPMIYSSQEIGHTAQLDFFNYHILDFTANTTTAAYRCLMHAYQQTAEARAGTLTDYSTDHVACFERRQGEKAMLVVVNTTSQPQTITLPMRWQRSAVTDAQTDERITTPKALELEGFAYRVYTN